MGDCVAYRKTVNKRYPGEYPPSSRITYRVEGWARGGVPPGRVAAHTHMLPYDQFSVPI